LATDHLPFGGLNDTQVVGSIGTEGSPSSHVQILVFIISGSILKRKESEEKSVLIKLNEEKGLQ